MRTTRKAFATQPWLPHTIGVVVLVATLLAGTFLAGCQVPPTSATGVVQPTATEPPPTASPAPRPNPPAMHAPEAQPADATGSSLSTARVTAIGDSVMVGAAKDLAAAIPGLDLDATIGRQASDTIKLLQQYRDAGKLGSTVIIDIGSNGTLTGKQFDQIMEVLKDVRSGSFSST